MKNIRPSDTKSDNVLLEYELACGLATKKLLNIFPILVGGGHRGTLEGVSYTSQLVPRQDDGEGNVPMFDFAKYGPHTFPKECSASSRTPITTTINTMLAYQGVILCSAAELTVYAGVAAADKKTSPLESRVFAVLNDTAWYNPENSLCIPGYRYWNGKAAAQAELPPEQAEPIEKVEEIVVGEDATGEPEILFPQMAPVRRASFNPSQVKKNGGYMPTTRKPEDGSANFTSAETARRATSLLPPVPGLVPADLSSPNDDADGGIHTPPNELEDGVSPLGTYLNVSDEDGTVVNIIVDGDSEVMLSDKPTDMEDDTMTFPDFTVPVYPRPSLYEEREEPVGATRHSFTNSFKAAKNATPAAWVEKPPPAPQVWEEQPAGPVFATYNFTNSFRHSVRPKAKPTTNRVTT
jgi:hypothetical protein